MEWYGRGVQEEEGDGGEWTIDWKWSKVDSESLRRSAEIQLWEVCGEGAGQCGKTSGESARGSVGG